MLPGMELMGCANLAAPPEVMRHVVRIESSFNPYAIGVVGGRLARQPRNLSEAVSTARMLEREGYNFSLGLAQVNRYNLASYGLDSYEKAFQACPNLQAGARILAECYQRSGRDWGKAFSCYYSGNFVTGFRHGYVQKVMASWRGEADGLSAPAIALAERPTGRALAASAVTDLSSIVMRRIQEAAAFAAPVVARAEAYPAVSTAMPVAMPQSMAMASSAAQIAPLQAVAGRIDADSDAPVLVQRVGAPPPQQTPSQSIAGQPTAGAAVLPRRDHAFVF